MRQINFILCLIALLFSSCYKDFDNTSQTKTVRPPKVKIETEFLGEIDFLDSSVSDSISIKIGGKFYRTVNGEFPLLKLDNVQKSGTFIEVFRSNDLCAALQLALIENDINNASLPLGETFKKKSLASGDLIEFTSDLSVSFEFAQLLDEDASTFSGEATLTYNASKEIKVNSKLSTFAFNKEGFVSVLDPSESFFIGLSKSSIGDLRIEDGEVLINYDGRSEDELFYFNEEEEAWEWVSSFASGINTEKVTKMGWYILGTSREAAEVEGILKMDSKPIAKQELQIVSDTYEKNILTTSNGKWLAFAPIDKETEIKIGKSEKDEIYSSFLDLNRIDQVVEVNLSPDGLTDYFLSANFEVLDCEGNSKEDRLLNITYMGGSIDRVALKKGKEAFIPLEQREFEVGSGEGPSFKWNSLSSEIHYLSSCANHDEGFSMVKIRNDRKLYPAFSNRIEVNRIIVNAVDNEMKLLIEATSRGFYESDMVNIAINDSTFGDKGYLVECENAVQGCGIEVCEITHFINDGDDWNRIYFKGKIWMQTIAPPQAGNFEVEGYILSKQ